jgi:hypothetical protein
MLLSFINAESKDGTYAGRSYGHAISNADAIITEESEEESSRLDLDASPTIETFFFRCRSLCLSNFRCSVQFKYASTFEEILSFKLKY